MSECSFDLTEELLKYVFQTLASRSRVAYDRNGAKQALLDNAFFQELVQMLDADQSQDINVDEFSQGIRLIMSRSLFQEYSPNNQLKWVEVLDYDAPRLQRQVVGRYGDPPFSGGGQEDIRLGSSAIRVEDISWKEFYFQVRTTMKTRQCNAQYLTYALLDQAVDLFELVVKNILCTEGRGRSQRTTRVCIGISVLVMIALAISLNVGRL